MDLRLIRTKNIYFGFSILMILFSLFSIFTKGFNLGIDFTGGNLYQLKFEKPDYKVKEYVKKFISPERWRKLKKRAKEKGNNRSPL